MERGYRRYKAYKKPPVSEATRHARLQFAREHINWSIEDWAKILWTDETWMTYGHHRPIYVTAKPSEHFDATCVRDRVQRKQGWMFWGCFSGGKKGPCLFWEKDWGTINSDSYQVSSCMRNVCCTRAARGHHGISKTLLTYTNIITVNDSPFD